MSQLVLSQAPFQKILPLVFNYKQSNHLFVIYLLQTYAISAKKYALFCELISHCGCTYKSPLIILFPLENIFQVQMAKAINNVTEPLFL